MFPIFFYVLKRRKWRHVESDCNGSRNAGFTCHARIETTEHGVEIHTFSCMVKVKQILSQHKIMPSVFRNRHNVLLLDFMQRGTTINVVAYDQTLQNLHKAIQNKRLRMLLGGIFLPHDNARSHIAAQARVLLDFFAWEDFCHLRPCEENYHFFQCLKHHLGNNNNDEDVKNGRDLRDNRFYVRNINKHKCLNKLDNYVEKWRSVCSIWKYVWFLKTLFRLDFIFKRLLVKKHTLYMQIILKFERKEIVTH